MKKSICLLLGILFLLSTLGALLIFGRNKWLSHILDANLVLSPTSSSFPKWKNLPVPLVMSVYVFEVVNPENILLGALPQLSQIGPFKFYENHEKTKIVWNGENKTVSYQQIRTWKYLNDSSSENLDRVVTVLNVPAAVASGFISKLSTFEQIMASLALNVLKEKLFVKVSVRELLFTSYNDPITKIRSPFAFFYGRNGTDSTDGVFNIYTGEGKLENFGQVATWNYRNVTDFFPDSCGEVRGSGDFFPPFLQGKDFVEMYSNDLCRPLRANLKDDKFESIGLIGGGYKYVVDKSFFANSSENPSNICYENGVERHSGVFDSSSCREKAGIFLSNPHFLNADSFYSSQFTEDSLYPNSSLHESFIVLEPYSGLPIALSIKIQINILLEQLDHVDLFKNIQTTFFPVIWSETKLEPNSEMLNGIWWLSQLTSIFTGLGLGLYIISVVICIALVFFHFFRSSASSEESLSILNNEITPNTMNQESSSYSSH